MSLTGRICLYRRYCATAIQFSRPCHTNPTSDKGEYSLIVGEDAPSGIVRPPLPIITSRELQYPPKFLKPRQSWVENLDTVESKKLGLVDLHPEVFGGFPRLDVLHANVQWQLRYNKVNWEFARSRAEMPGGGRKPWPQKGLGKARAGSIRSPLFVRGGKAHGARGPTSQFYMLPYYTRIKGLTSALSAKFAQDDLKIVDSLEITTTDPKFLENMFDHRDWGPAVLIVDDTDIMPKNITIATERIKHVILMPVYGLNVFSMLKYHTLVMTVRALEKLEEKLLYAMNRLDHREVNCSFKTFKHY